MSFVKLTEKAVVQRERVIAVVNAYNDGWSKVYLASQSDSVMEVEVNLTLDEVFAKLEVPTIHEEVEGADLVKR